jgi:hypothetical protein
MMAKRFRKKPTTETSDDKLSSSMMDSNSSTTTEPKNGPNSPKRNVLFKKKRKDIETYQELEQTSSADNDKLSDLSSTLRFEGIKNFSPTKSLEGIHQFDVNANEFLLESSLSDPYKVNVMESGKNEGRVDEAFDKIEDFNKIQVQKDEMDMAIIQENPIEESDSNAVCVDSDDCSSKVKLEENHTTNDDEQMPIDVTCVPSKEEDAENGMKCSHNDDAVVDTIDVISTLSPGGLSSIPQDRMESQQVTFVESDAFTSDTKIDSSNVGNTRLDISPPSNKKPVEGILRTSTTEVYNVSSIPSPTVGDNHQASTHTHLIKNNTTYKKKGSKKAVSFADENGGIISELQTIDVSPSKLSRKIRRGKSSLAGYDYFDEEGFFSSSKSQNGVMGRVLVLLMDPPTKQYELTSVPYPLVSNEGGVVGPTMLKVILGLVATSASYEPLRIKNYKGFMRPDDVEMMENERTILDYKFIKDEVLVAIPEGYGVEECSIFSKPILQDKRLVKLLKRLKRHERKAEKKRRLRIQEGMKPSSHYAGMGRDAKFLVGRGTRQRNGIFGDGIVVSTLRFLGIICTLLLVISILLGAGKYMQEKKAQELLLLAKTIKENNPGCGRGSFCKPFGVKQNVKEQDKAFLAKLRDGIRNWKLESDDLML